jgi:hypothetical protein
LIQTRFALLAREIVSYLDLEDRFGGFKGFVPVLGETGPKRFGGFKGFVPVLGEIGFGFV